MPQKVRSSPRLCNIRHLLTVAPLFGRHAQVALEEGAHVALAGEAEVFGDIYDLLLVNHDIVTLWKQCEAILPEFNRFASRITILDDYAVFPRYPNELQLSESDMSLALQYAKDIKAFVEPLIKGES
jgi:hypothetical protein